jgi:hypothetical protein
MIPGRIFPIGQKPQAGALMQPVYLFRDVILYHVRSGAGEAPVAIDMGGTA